MDAFVLKYGCLLYSALLQVTFFRPFRNSNSNEQTLTMYLKQSYLSIYTTHPSHDHCNLTITTHHP